jgi:Leucine-rich repeat (LRR) protein
LFFEGKSKDLFQIHFETNQIKDRRNDSNVSIYENVIKESESISNFFYEELMPMAKEHNKGLDNNVYLDYLVKFGFADSLFELLDDETPTIRFMTREIPKLPNMSKFKNLDQIIITGARLTEIDSSIGTLDKLEMLVLTNNKLKTLPKEIGDLKNLKFLNIIGNPDIELPDEIKYLDKSNGGQLHRIGVKVEEIGELNYLKLKELLPQTII